MGDFSNSAILTLESSVSQTKVSADLKKLTISYVNAQIISNLLQYNLISLNLSGVDKKVRVNQNLCKPRFDVERIYFYFVG